MARKKKLTKQDSIRDAFSFDGFEANHFRRTESYAAAIDRLYDAAVADFARLASTVTVDPDKPFEFAKGPAFQAKAQEIVDRLAAGMSAVIRTGTEKEWLYANQKNDAFLKHIMDTSKIGKRTMNKLSDRNLNALDAFQKRKVGGLDLSQRVWQYAGQTKSLMEMGIDIAVGDGRPATKLSRDLRSYLHEPEKLFRRVRDKHGNLVLSQRAAAYHPGQGVYRSSYMNAMRLARTEINMAYRDADRRRWAAMDFVVGFRIVLSNTHPEKDICDRLAGDYPKDFVFKGWHPQCKCHVIPILMDRDEFNTDELNELKAAIRGDQYEAMASRKTVTDIPEGFKDWIEENRERSLSWSKQPYFIRDNFAGGTLEGALQLKKPTIAKPQPKTKDWDDIDEAERTRYQDRFERIFMSDEWDDLVFACRWYSIDMSLILKMKNAWPANYDQIAAIEAEFNRLKAQCDAAAATMRQTSESLNKTALAKIAEWKIWGSASWAGTDHLWNHIKDDRWPNWPSMERALTTIIEDADKGIAAGKTAFDAAIQKAKTDIVAFKADGKDVSALEALIKIVPTEQRNAPALIKEIQELTERVRNASKSTFVPAKTIEEAEKFASQFVEKYGLDRTFKGEVSFKGMSVEMANEVNHAIADAFATIGITKISGIKTISGSSARGAKIFTSDEAVAAYDPVSRGIWLNTDVLKSAEAHAAYIARSKAAWKTVMDNLDKLSPAKREIALRYKAAGRELVDETVRGSILHELGHHTQWTSFTADQYNAISKDLANFASKISGYASMNGREYFAESFVAYMKGETAILDPRFVAEMDRISANAFADLIKLLEKDKIAVNEVQMLTKTLTEEEIITRLAGGDKTKGSCSSLAFAYAANKAGMDVLDFRGGSSQNAFSTMTKIQSVIKVAGGKIAKNISDYKKAEELLKECVVGKEYYFTCGSHAAIVRKTKEGGFEYLELQSSYSNGFKPLTKQVLKDRFGAKHSRSSYGHKYETSDVIVEISRLKTIGYRKLMGYINTASDNQQKGVGGTIK